MSIFYDQHLSPKLLAVVSAMQQRDPHEQISVYTELALMRENAGHAVALYSAAREAHDNNPTEQSQQRVISAGAIMAEALDSVVDTCAKAAKIGEKQKERYSIHDLKYIIERMLVLHGNMLQELDLDEKTRDQINDSFQELVSRDLVLPDEASQGTTLTPDMTAREFDASIPYVTDDEAEKR